jgi:hypothetical protein
MKKNLHHENTKLRKQEIYLVLFAFFAPFCGYLKPQMNEKGANDVA